MAITMFANLPQISFAGIGIREGLAAWLMANYIPPVSAAAAAFAGFFLDRALPGLIGIVIPPAVLKEEGRELQTNE